MWQRFTERARRVVFFAQEEAGKLGVNYVSTEHLLLGILREDDCTAYRILEKIGTAPDRVRAALEEQINHSDGRMGPEMQLTPLAKRIIDFAYDEARKLGNNYIGSEHILLGLIREEKGMAGEILGALNTSLDKARTEVRRLQDTQPSQTAPTAPPTTLDSPSVRELIRSLGDIILALDPTLRDAPLETLQAALFGAGTEEEPSSGS